MIDHIVCGTQREITHKNFVDFCLTSNEQYFSYNYYENKFLKDNKVVLGLIKSLACQIFLVNYHQQPLLTNSCSLEDAASTYMYVAGLSVRGGTRYLYLPKMVFGTSRF